MGYTEALFKALKKMGPMESSFLMQELGISHHEWAAVADELQKRVNMKVTVDTEEVVNESEEAKSVFVVVKSMPPVLCLQSSAWILAAAVLGMVLLHVIV